MVAHASVLDGRETRIAQGWADEPPMTRQAMDGV
jgi:hypothetical protein